VPDILNGMENLNNNEPKKMGRRGIMGLFGAAAVGGLAMTNLEGMEDAPATVLDKKEVVANGETTFYMKVRFTDTGQEVDKVFPAADVRSTAEEGQIIKASRKKMEKQG
jgi:hypothetical protein